MTKAMVNGVMSNEIHVMDRGFQYGDGVFETMRVVNHGIPLWEKHWQRLNQACEQLAIKLPEKHIIERQLAIFLEDLSGGIVKMIVTRGIGERGYVISEQADATVVFIQAELPGYPDSYYVEGVPARICETRLAQQPALAGIKHLNRLEQVIARNEWHDRAIVEGIMLDMDDNVIEGIVSNLFLVRDNTVITAKLDVCGVSGVMRRTVLELLEKEAIPFKITRVSKDELLNADEVFITNSIIGLWPVQKIDDTVYQVGKITRLLQDKIQRILNDA